MTSSIARTNRNGLIPFFAIFLFALAVRVWFNFGTAHPNAAFAADAAEYLRDAQSYDHIFRLSPAFWGEACQGILNGPESNAAVAVRTDLAPFKELATSGPVLPLIIWGSAQLGGSKPDFGFWQMPVLAYCLVSSLTCVLIALIGKQCWTKETGYLAGFLSSVYPGFIVNTGRLYNEPLATFLGCLILYLVISSLLQPPKQYAKIVLIGFTAACLQVTRSIMAALSLLLIPLICLFNKGKVKENLLSYALGFALLVFPWLVLQQCIFGKASLVIDRYGHFNLFIGNNVDTLGWFSFPYPESGDMKDKSIKEIADVTVLKSPERWLKLALDKPVRLLKRPWNDFKTAIGSFDYASQIVFHQLLLFMAAIGLVGGLLLDFNKAGSRKVILCRCLAFSYFLFHFVYAIFIAVPRYESTALPVVIVFAAASFAFLQQLCSTKGGVQKCAVLLLAMALLFVALNINAIDFLAATAGERTVYLGLALQVVLRSIIFAAILFVAVQSAKSIKEPARLVSTLAILLFLTALPAISLPLRAHGRFLEWNRSFDKAGSTVTQNIFVPSSIASNLSKRQSFLMVYLNNGNTIQNDIKITINGKDISAPIVPAMALAQELDQLNKLPNGVILPEPDFIVDDILAHTGNNELDLQGWYLIPLSNQLISGNNQLITVNNILNVKLEKISNRPNRIYGAYNTGAKSIVVPSVGLYAWEKGFWGVEGAPNCNDLSLDEKIATPQIVTTPDNLASSQSGGATLNNDAVTNSDAASNSQFPPHPYIRLLISPQAAQADNSFRQLAEFHSESAIDNQSIDRNGSLFLNVPVNKTLSCPGNAVLFARVTGEHLPLNCTVQLNAFFKDNNKIWAYPCHWLPKSTTTKSTDFTFPITLKDIPGKLSGFSMSIASTNAVPSISMSKRLDADCAMAAENHDKTQISASMPAKAPPAPPSAAGLQSHNDASTTPAITVRIYEMPINPTAPGHEIL
jgi:Dolichyl-phosphate-mannose-protein mannosyltransferase